MKCLVIPDVHGTRHWCKAKKLIDNYDKVVFLGDYVDNWKNKQPEQKNNLIAIIRFKQKNPEKVDLLWGNHDTSYFLNERCSGYQPEQAFDYYELFNVAKNNFEVVAIYDNWIFSHAGISKEWLRCCGIKTPQEINQLFKERPNFFRWVGPEPTGNSENEGPLWIRPDALRRTAIDNYCQCIGHSEVREDSLVGTNIEFDYNKQIILIDSPKHDCFTEIDTVTGEIKSNITK